jgi:hypothetical protein
MIEFNEGDKVRVIRPECGKRRGSIGTVVEIDGDYVGVEFKGWADGHDGPFKDHRKTCWNFFDVQKQLLVIEPTPVKPEPAPKVAKPDQSYKGNGKHTWECVVVGGVLSPRTERLRVPGGWLYKPRATSAVFVPMPEVVKHKV